MFPIPSIILLSASAAIIAVTGFLLVHRLVKPIDLGEHQGFLDAMLSIVGTLVSILLGLLVAASLDHYQTLEQSVDNEAANVGQVYRISNGLPKGVREKLQADCNRYCDQVVQDEWPAMAKGEYSHKVLFTYIKMLEEIVTYEPTTNGKTNLHSSLLGAMQQIADCRRQRLLALHSAWGAHLMPVLLMCSGIVLAFAYLYVRKGAVLHAVLICFVAIALGGNLGLVFLLSNPFSGDWQIRPRGFELNKQIFQEVQTSSDLKSLMEGTAK
jgi:Protein of unknown function (DUF4239)